MDLASSALRKIRGVDETPVHPHDVDTLASSFGLELERLRRDPEFGLPQRVVDQQRKLADLSERELQELLLAVAVALAVTKDGTSTPRRVLKAAFDAARFSTWEDEVKPKIKRLRYAMQGTRRDER
jgi:hypothetical protein